MLKQNDMHTTNTLNLSAKQEENLSLIARDLYVKSRGDNYTHFSYEGNRLNFRSFNHEAIWFVANDNSNFYLTIELNKQKQALKSTFKIHPVKENHKLNQSGFNL